MITNNKGRLSNAEIQRLVPEAEIYKLEDEEHKRKVDLRNSFEDYAYSMRDTINSIEWTRMPVDKEKIEDAVNNAIEWLGINELADIDRISDKMNNLEILCNPVITKMH